MKKGLLIYMSSTLDYAISFVHDQITIHIIEIYTNVIKKKLVLKIMFTIK